MGKEQAKVTPEEREEKLRKVFTWYYDKLTKELASGGLTGGSIAAYLAWATRRNNMQDDSPLDLELSPVERVTKEVIKELKCRG